MKNVSIFIKPWDLCIELDLEQLLDVKE